MSGRQISVCLVMQSLDAGGAERVGLTILRYLDRSRFAIELLVLGDEKGPLRSEVPDDIDLTFLGKRHARWAIWHLSGILRSKRPDILLVNLSHLNLLVAMFRWLLPRPMTIVARETNVISKNNQEYRFPSIWGTLFRLFYRRLDHVICQSNQMYRDLVDNFSMPAHKASIIGNPTNIKHIRSLAETGSKPRFPATRTKLVAVGTLHSRKNFDGLIRALAQCGDKDIGVEILGDGPERGRLGDLVEELGLADRVHLAGYVRNPYPSIAAADALILTSAYEGLPNVVLEALALQTPVIATPAGGVCKDLLADRHGCVVAEDESDKAISNAILQWISRAPYEIDKDAVQSFDAPVIVKRYEDLFASVLG